MGKDSENYRDWFKGHEAPEPPADLKFRTLRAIAARERRILIAKLVGFAALFAASAAVGVAELVAAGVQIGQSGFVQFGSLFFSDFGAVAGNLQDAVLSLVESFPAFTAGIALGGLAVAGWSLSGFVNDARMLRAG
ncbi:MAG TPA: hypothetical protein VMT99_03360 [Candidatus Paceibacterota bacterium]|nr:hypothetical protein [Candidatus Paceibacterota bacterium]